MRQKFERGFAPIIVLLILVVVGLGGYFAYKSYIEPKGYVLAPSLEPSITPTCANTNISGYVPAKTSFLGNPKNNQSTFSADLKGDGTQETIMVYEQKSNGERNKPEIVQIFSGNSSCYKLEFSYGGNSGDRSGNERGFYRVLNNFWGKGQNAFLFEPVSTGYGSGSSSLLNFITYDKSTGKYKVIQGPILSELSSFKYNGSDFIGNKILVAESVWGEDENHFEPHQIHFISYNWNGSSYVINDLGITTKKYDFVSGNDTIDSIIRMEPSVVNPIVNSLFTNPQYKFSFNYPAGSYKLNSSFSSDNTIGNEFAELVTLQGDGKIRLFYINQTFNDNYLKNFAPPGLTNISPVPVTYGNNTFYYYGYGVGLNNPDRYFYNLNGKILLIEFAGPYGNDSHSPTTITKVYEKIILDSFKIIP